MLYPVMDRMSMEVHYWAKLGIVSSWSNRILECTKVVDAVSREGCGYGARRQIECTEDVDFLG